MEPMKGKQPTQGETLIRLANSNFKFVHDELKDAYAVRGNETIRVRSSTFRQRLARLLYLSAGKAPNSDSINQCLNILEAQANCDGECITLHNRVAELVYIYLERPSAFVTS